MEYTWAESMNLKQAPKQDKQAEAQTTNIFDASFRPLLASLVLS